MKDFTMLLAGAAAFSWAPTSLAANDLRPIVPTDTTAKVGLAGAHPAEIGRYLLARGALGAKISPDGEQVAFLLNVAGPRQLWIISAEGGAPRQLTFGAGVTFFEWTPDSASLLYGADNNGDEQESYYLITADGASERLVLPAVDGGFRAFGAFSPDGARFAFSSTERNGDDFDIYVAELASGDSRMVYEGRYGFSVGGWIPGGETLAVYETVGEDSDNLHLLNVGTGVLTTVFQPDTPANFSSGFGGGAAMALAPDGSAAYLSRNDGREFLALGAYDFATGGFKLIDEAAHADLEHPVLCGERYLAYTINESGFDRLRVRDLKREREVLAPPLPDGVLSLSCASGTDRLLIRLSAYDTPGDLYVWEVGDKAAERIFSSNLAGLSAKDFIKPVSIRLAAKDGVMLQGLLYRPTGMAPGVKPPVLFDVHGGPTAQSKAEYNPSVQYHVARGVAVFEPNVRGSTGFGRTYLGLDNRKKRLDSVQDLVDMLAFLGREGAVDATRAAVKGGSYGGYMVNAVLGAHPGVFKVGVCLYGVADWVTALEVASPALKASDRIEYGDISEPEWREFYAKNSPINNAGKIEAPVLFSHGAQDPRINKAETETMVRALRKRRIEAPYVLFPDEGHGWKKLSNQLFYYRLEAEFLGEHLLGQKAPQAGAQAN